MQSEGVFHLIQSMSKAEKRFFRRFAEMSGGKQAERYLLLFSTIEGLDEDDPEELSKRLDGSPLAEHLPVYRNRLQNLILRSLRTLYAGRWAGSEIRQLLEEIELLFERRLYTACTKRLDKALELARTHQQEAILLELATWRRKLTYQAPLPQQNALLADIRIEEAACLGRLSHERSSAHEHERKRVQARLRLLTRSPQERETLTALDPSIPANFLTQVHFHSARAILEFSENDFAAAGNSYRHIMSLWDNEPLRIADHPDLYLQTFNNYLSVLLVGDQHHDEFLAAVQKLRQLTELPRHTRVNFQWVAYHQELIFSMNFVGYEATLRLVGEIEKWIDQNMQEILVPRLLAFYFNITMFFFVNGEYSRANRWLSRILHQPGRAERRDIRNFARILQVLLQYEMQNIDLNEYLMRSAYRYLNRKDELYAFELAIFTLIRKCGALHNEAARRPVYEDFRNALLALRTPNQSALGHGEIQLWVESKLSGIPPRKLFEQKLAENQSAARMR